MITQLNPTSILDDTIHSSKLKYNCFKTVNNNNLLETGNIEIIPIPNIEIIITNDNNIEAYPNKYYKCTNTELSILYIKLMNDNDLDNYFIEFTTSAEGTSIALPGDISWNGNRIPELKPNTTYQLSIFNKFCNYISF